MRFPIVVLSPAEATLRTSRAGQAVDFRGLMLESLAGRIGRRLHARGTSFATEVLALGLVALLLVAFQALR